MVIWIMGVFGLVNSAINTVKRAGIKPKTEDDDLVKVRDYINTYGRRYGIKDTDVGFRSDPETKKAYVTLGGTDLVNPSKIENGSSYMDENSLRGAIDNYATKFNLYDSTAAAKMPEAPAAFESPYKTETDALIKEILDTPDFAYNKDADPLYGQYKKEYTDNADRTFNNEIGDLSALTGGRLNSWAVSAASGAQQNIMQDLDNIIPELEERALDRYNNNIAQKTNRLAVLRDADNTEYGKYRDKILDYNNDRNFSRGAFESDRTFDFNKGEADRTFDFNNTRADRSDFENDRSYNYQVTRDKILDGRWLKQFDEETRRALVNEALQSRQISVSEANTALSRDRLDWEKSDNNLDNKYKKAQLDKIAKDNNVEQTLGPLYNSMMNSGDPKQWLKQNSAYLEYDELTALIKLLPEEKSALDKKIEEALGGN